MEKLRVGVVGLRRGMAHFKNFLSLEDVQVIGAADRFPERRKAAQQTLDAMGASGVKIMAEYDELLAMKPDAVCVATHGKLQCQHGCQAMEAGVHVLSEVPGSYTMDEWVRLRDAVQRTGMIYMMGENSSFLDFLRYWRKWLIEGRLGEISIAEAEYLHHLPASLQLPDGSRLSPTEAKARGVANAVPIWRADQPPIQYLTHDLGPLLEVLDDRVVSVSCRNAPWRCVDAPLRTDGQIALFETAKGVLFKVMVTFNTKRPFEHRYMLYGTEGSAEWFQSERWCRRSLKDSPHSRWERVAISQAAASDVASGHGGTDYKVARHFVDTVLHGKPNPVDVYRAIEYSLPGMIANRSAELGGAPLSIPDLRVAPFTGTRFWDIVGLPEAEPEVVAG
ncbi:MAG: Gfo/Idh/MocA family oxidoreductase [Candidatus Sumerlaeota bacterium]|nr:Gfo/Idh/MocA family oxidoreductase [Candidatus Sumerlaeota bacterium]